MHLREFTQAFGVSGREEKAVRLIKELLSPMADETIVDALGSLILFRKGSGENKRRLMIAAHIDQIGLCVSGVDDKGFLRVRPLGYVSVAAAHTSRVLFSNGVRGVAYVEEFDGTKNDTTKLFIDIGAKSREDALERISLGDVACFEGELEELANSRFLSRGFDDRIGCYILAEAFERLAEPYNDLYFSFSTQEELGIRGTKVAAQRVQPDIGLAFDIGGAYDTPDTKGAGLGNAVMGGGAAIKVVDGYMFSDDGLNRFLKELCLARGIPHQVEVAAGGGTDGAMIQLAGEGARSTTISIPTRYGHSASEMIDMDDVNACIDLLQAACMADLSSLFE